MKTLNEFLNPINEAFNDKNINIKENNIYCMCVTGEDGSFDDEKLKGFVGVYTLDNLIDTNFSDGFVLADIFEKDDEDTFKSKLKSLKIGESIVTDDEYIKVNIIRIS